MIHYFNIDIATQFGVNEAIMLQNIAFWSANNKANERNFFDGRYWTYNSVKAFKEIFPYLSIRQIRKALSNLENNNGLIVSGNYNKSKYDRTKWYALSDLGLQVMNSGSNMHSTNLTNDNYHLHDLTNGLVDNNQPIPDSKLNNKLNIYEEEEKKEKTDVVSELVEIYNSLGKPFRKVTKITKGRRAKTNERLKEMGGKEVFIDIIKLLPTKPFLRGENDTGWMADFDFIIQNSEKWVKIKEGGYDKRFNKGGGEKFERKPKIEQYHNNPELDNFDVSARWEEYQKEQEQLNHKQQ